MKKSQLPKVVIKKLGKQRALGQAFTDKNLIEIDPRQKPQSLFDTEIHEFLHIRFPDWSETKVKTEATALRKFLWKQKYRKIND
jgi:hypothetical protein